MSATSFSLGPGETAEVEALADELTGGLMHHLLEAGYTPEDIVKLSEGDELARILSDLRQNTPALVADSHHVSSCSRNGAMVSQTSLVLDCSEMFQPESSIDLGWRVWREDEQTARLTSVDFSVVNFRSCLKDHETSVSGWIKRTRLQRDPEIPLGARHFQALMQDYEMRRRHSVLEHLRQHRHPHVTYVDFFGTILADPQDCLRVACLWYEDEHWKIDFRYVNRSSWHKKCKSATLPEKCLQS